MEIASHAQMVMEMQKQKVMLLMDNVRFSIRLVIANVIANRNNVNNVFQDST